jgi:hypothetical protein
MHELESRPQVIGRDYLLNHAPDLPQAASAAKGREKFTKLEIS